MRKIFIIIFACISSMFLAQGKSLEFYYISHDRNTPIADLCSKLQYAYDTAENYEDVAVIFYLPNGKEPIIVKMNLDGESGDNRKDFKNIISDLWIKTSHDAYSDIDYANIVNLINTYDFIDEKGSYTYTSVLFNWYINSDFWKYGLNERLISSLYFTLELDKYNDYISTQIWYPSGDELEVDENYPFGTKNYCKDMWFMLLPY